MMEALINAALRLAEALRAENEALTRLDLAAAGELARGKRQAADAFAAAYEAASRLASRGDADGRARAEDIAARLRALTAENRRLLERAIALQSRVIETIAGAARPPGPGTYGAGGRARGGRAGATSLARLA
jgi:flagellar biosynthesis/type III secretory pathway chaperone